MDIPPPIGAAPDNHDYNHPWIISGIISASCFAVGFFLLYSTRLWSNFTQWADWPFVFYCAILAPVLLGFYTYGVCRLIMLLFKGRRGDRETRRQGD
jgi:uncharacterized protein (DUF2062 family)